MHEEKQFQQPTKETIGTFYENAVTVVTEQPTTINVEVANQTDDTARVDTLEDITYIADSTKLDKPNDNNTVS